MFFNFERQFAIIILLFFLLFTSIGVAGSIFINKDIKKENINFELSVPKEYNFNLKSSQGKAFVDGKKFTSLDKAIEFADSGDTVYMSGLFDGNIVINKSDITLEGKKGLAIINGSGKGDVLTLNGKNITIDSLWIRNSGYETSKNDAGIWVDAPNSTIVNSRITEITFGIWIDGVKNIYIRNNTIIGREEITPLSYRGNGIQVWETKNTQIINNRITDVRDGIYYSFASKTIATQNTMWDLRYGVHYMYSDNCILKNNTAFNNDVGWALMVSQKLQILNNVAVNNTGTSGHGILVKDIDNSKIKGNDLIANEKGLFIYNSLNNTFANNLILENNVGIHITAGSVEERVYNNSFINNNKPVIAVIGKQVEWNTTNFGNYWSKASTVDMNNDGISEIRYRPVGLIENIVNKNPKSRVFSKSPAFDAIRMAQSSIPVVESPGIIDYYPLVYPKQNWRKYYEYN